MFNKHLKIVEQIAIVFVFAVIVPMTVSGFIINNINQQAMRYQLRESAVLIANMVSDEIDFFNNTVNGSLEQIAFHLKYFPSDSAKNSYLNTIVKKLPACEKLIVANESQIENLRKNNKEKKLATVTYKILDGKYLVASYKISAKHFLFCPKNSKMIHL